VNKIAVILGKGAVGTRCGMVLSAMKMNVRYLERNGASIHDAVRDADLVVNCLSSSSSNANILNADFFNIYMSRGSTFISMTNPVIYDIDGLLSALSTERLSGAAIDIGNTFPGDVHQTNYAKFMNFLNTYPEYENVLLVTPQVAHFADASQSTSFDMAIENIRYAVEDKLDCIPDRVWN
jgi:phosphoglycerate dehydrogenase-like enzyme